MQEEWVSTGEVARRVGYSTRWVEHQIELGRLPATAFIGARKRTYRVRTSDLEVFVRTFFEKAPAPEASKR